MSAADDESTLEWVLRLVGEHTRSAAEAAVFDRLGSGEEDPIEIRVSIGFDGDGGVLVAAHCNDGAQETLSMVHAHDDVEDKTFALGGSVYALRRVLSRST